MGGVVAGRTDGHPRREQVQARTVVGERGPPVLAVGGADGQGRGRARGRAQAGVAVLVARGHHDRNALGRGAGDGGIHRAGRTATQGHVGHGGQGRVGRHPVDARDHAAGAARARAPEHAHGHQGDRLGDAPGRAADGSGDMRAVPVAVRRAAAVVDDGKTRSHPAAEVGVPREDAGVDDVGPHAGPLGGVGVEGVQRQVALVGAVQPPGGIGLNGLLGVDRLVGLHQVHGRVVLHGLHEIVGARSGHLHGEAVDRGGIGVCDITAERPHRAEGNGGGADRVIAQQHDVAAGALGTRPRTLGIHGLRLRRQREHRDAQEDDAAPGQGPGSVLCVHVSLVESRVETTARHQPDTTDNFREAACDDPGQTRKDELAFDCREVTWGHGSNPRHSRVQSSRRPG